MIKTYVLLDFEGGNKYKKYKHDLEVTVTSTRECYCLFKLLDKLVCNGKGRVLKVICGCHNHELVDIIFGHPYTSILKSNEHFILVDMTKIIVKSTSILLTLKKEQ